MGTLTPGILEGDCRACIHVLFTAPTAFRAIKRRTRTVCTLKYDLSKFRMLFLAGERCDPDTLCMGRKEAECAWLIIGGRQKQVGR